MRRYFSMSSLNCPRCGEQSYEHFKSYSYCPQCNHSSEYELLEEETETLEAIVRALELRPKRLKNSSKMVLLPDAAHSPNTLSSQNFSKLGAATRSMPDPRSAVWAS